MGESEHRIELGEWAGELQKLLLDPEEEVAGATEWLSTKKMYGLIYGGRSKEEEEEFKDVYMPKKVGLGPRCTDYIHIRPNPKEASLAVALCRSKEEGESLLDVLERFYNRLNSVAEELKSAYDTLDQKWHQDHASFVQMMLLDGLFLLEVFDYFEDEYSNPVIRRMFEKEEDKKRCLHDILLLQNQLPMDLLFTLRRIQRGCTDLHSIDESEWYFFGYFVISLGLQTRHDPTRIIFASELENKLNILDLYRSRVLYYTIKKEIRWGAGLISKIFKPIKRGRLTRYNISEYIPPATKLHDSGITFQMSTSTFDPYIIFSHNTLKLPQIEVDSYTKSHFLNLIAFEKLHKHVDNRYHVSSYMYLMGCLVHGAEDVTLLQSHGIIVSNLPRAQVAAIFNTISQNISLHPDDLSSDFQDMVVMVRGRYNKLTNEWRKDLFKTYLKSPWAVISLLGALFIFILTLIQTVYAILTYKNRK